MVLTLRPLLGIARTSVCAHKVELLRTGVRSHLISSAVFLKKSSRCCRRHLQQKSALAESAGMNISKAELTIAAPSKSQLRNLFWISTIPMVGFGFADNAIMICAGEAIDETFGNILRISTMAAAGLGNALSDVCGIFLADKIMFVATKFGLPLQTLTTQQMDLRVCTKVKLIGSVIGITVGCILGMAPLLFMNSREEETLEHLFDSVDADGNGRLSFSEIQAASSKLGLICDKENMSRELGLSSKDLDVGITCKEFIRLHKRQSKDQ
eukprot:m.171678 g.171678  ORF g.171678 m.171678 type:complete len:268 (+) comp31657_c0_seq1:425-1228(+)